MSLPQIIDGFAAIADKYDAILCDIWGVLHNGQVPFDGVDDALNAYRAQGGKVLLLSNAPRPGISALKRLDALGNRRSSYDDILTSGDATRAKLNELGAQGQRCCHIGPDKDTDLSANLDIELVDLEAADIVLFSGMYDDMNETPEDYAPMLTEMHVRGLPMLCPNPDRTVMIGSDEIYCAGAVAELYENMGGSVIWMGKPYPVVYQRANEMLKKMTDLNTPRILAIGDGPKTDMPGAAQAGIDALFIAGGLAGAAGAKVDTAEEIGAILAADNTHARYAMRHLIW